MERPLPSVAPFLARREFTFAEAVAASRMPAGRVAHWLKTEAFTLFDGAATGTGNRRTFHLFDIYGLALFGALTDPESLGLPLKTARAILASAMYEDDPGRARAGEAQHAEHVAFIRRQLREGRLYHRGEDVRDRRLHRWLIGYRERRTNPDMTFWRGNWQSPGTEPPLPPILARGESQLIVAIDTMPILMAADRALIEMRGLADLFPHVMEPPTDE